MVGSLDSSRAAYRFSSFLHPQFNRGRLSAYSDDRLTSLNRCRSIAHEHVVVDEVQSNLNMLQISPKCSGYTIPLSARANTSLRISFAMRQNASWSFASHESLLAQRHYHSFFQPILKYRVGFELPHILRVGQQLPQQHPASDLYRVGTMPFVYIQDVKLPHLSDRSCPGERNYYTLKSNTRTTQVWIQHNSATVPFL